MVGPDILTTPFVPPPHYNTLIKTLNKNPCTRDEPSKPAGEDKQGSPLASERRAAHSSMRGLQLGQMAGVPSLRGNDMETESVSEPEKYSPPSCFHMSTLPQQMDILGVSLEDPKFLDMPLVLLLVICTGDEPPWTCGFG